MVSAMGYDFVESFAVTNAEAGNLVMFHIRGRWGKLSASPT